MMRTVTSEDKLFFFERNFFTLDGLWIIEVENETGWETALKVDIVVWQRLYQIIFRRVKKYLKITTNTIPDLVKIISFCWSCEGYEYEVIENTPESATIHITQCPYKAAMDRNPDRHDRIRDICLRMCIPFYEPALKDFNTSIKLVRTEFLGVGHDRCNFKFSLVDVLREL